MATVLTDKRGERFVDTVTRSDGKSALVVETGTDIEIGAIEIKDATTEDRANVVLRGDGKYALAVDVSASIAKTDKITTGQNNIASTSTSTLASYTVTTGKKSYLTQIIISGGNGTFEIKVDGSTKYIYRTSGSDKSKTITCQELQLSAGQVVSVDCTNDYHRSNVFDCTIQAYEVDL